MKLQILMLCALLIFVGCQEVVTTETSFLNLDKTTISVGSESCFVEFSITSNVKWELFCSEDWLDLSPNISMGSLDPVTVTITVKSNKDSDKRAATVDVLGYGSEIISRTLTIRQEGNVLEVQPKLSISEKELFVSADKGASEIFLESNVDWKALASNDWISVSPSSGNGSEHLITIDVTYSANESDSSRNATICFLTASDTKTVKVIQNGKSQVVKEDVTDAGIDDWIKDDDELNAN